MSYDLTGYRPQPGESIEQALDRLEELAADRADLTDAQWQQIEHLAAQIAAAAPGGEMFSDRNEAVAELTYPDGWQVYVFAHEVGLSLTYGANPSEVDFERLAAVLAVLAAAGWTIYDPQLDRTLNPLTASQLRAGFEGSLDIVAPALADPSPSHTRPETSGANRWWDWFSRGRS